MPGASIQAGRLLDRRPQPAPVLRTKPILGEYALHLERPAASTSAPRRATGSWSKPPPPRASGTRPRLFRLRGDKPPARFAAGINTRLRTLLGERRGAAVGEDRLPTQCKPGSGRRREGRLSPRASPPDATIRPLRQAGEPRSSPAQLELRFSGAHAPDSSRVRTRRSPRSRSPPRRGFLVERFSHVVPMGRPPLPEILPQDHGCRAKANSADPGWPR